MLGRRVICPREPANQRTSEPANQFIILQIVGFLHRGIGIRMLLQKSTALLSRLRQIPMHFPSKQISIVDLLRLLLTNCNSTPIHHLYFTTWTNKDGKKLFYFYTMADVRCMLRDPTKKDCKLCIFILQLILSLYDLKDSK